MVIFIPFKKFHTARVGGDPSKYDKIITKDLGDGIQMLIGYYNEGGKEKSEPESYHFDKSIFKKKSEVTKWLKEHDLKTSELVMAKKESDVKENKAGWDGAAAKKEFKEDLTAGMKEELNMKENSIVSKKGEVYEETVPIDRVPDKVFGNVRQSDILELLDRSEEVDPESVEVLEGPEEDEFASGDEEDNSEGMPEIEESNDSEEVQASWQPEKSKQDFMDWAKDNEGRISKKDLMKWYLDVDGGDGQDPTGYRYPVGAMIEGEPHHCPQALDHSWQLASGNETGIANRNIQKKIVFLKNRYNFPLTEDQMDFTERHMSAYEHPMKLNYHCKKEEQNGEGPGSCGGAGGKSDKDTFKEKMRAYFPNGVLTDNATRDIDNVFAAKDYNKNSPIKRSVLGNAKLSGKVEQYMHGINLTPYGSQAYSSGDVNYRVVLSAEHKDVPDTILDERPSIIEDYDTEEEAKQALDTYLKTGKTTLGSYIDIGKNKNFAKIVHQKRNSFGDMFSILNNNELIVDDINSGGGIDIVNTSETELKMNSSPAGSNIIYEDDSVIDVPVVPMREGVFTGTDGIPTLKKFEYFGKDAHWLEGQPILKGHTRPTEFVTYKHNRIGKLMNVTARPDKKDVVAVARYYKEKLSPEDLTRIRSSVPYDGSIAYTTHTSFQDGDYEGHKYNAVEDGGYHFYHFAELANGIGACSTKDGCGFMLNEQGYEPKVFYNNKRRAEITRNDDVYNVKLNSSIGGSGILESENESEAIEWSKTYVRSGLIPISMKLNYNCPDSEKSGSGKGACGGSDVKESGKEKSTIYKTKDETSGKEIGVTIPGENVKSIVHLGKNIEQEGNVFSSKNHDKIAEIVPSKSGLSTSIRDENGKMVTYTQAQFGKNHKEVAMLNAKNYVARGTGKLDDPEAGLSPAYAMQLKRKMDKLRKSQKQNSKLSNISGNNMTEQEFIQADDETVIDVQKMNETFEAKLNERDSKINELETQLSELVQKQNAVDEAIVAEKAKADFEAFSQKLNAASQKDAEAHYNGFLEKGWSYFDEHPVFKAEVPKMNARGVSAGEGDNGSGLKEAREMFKKAQKDRYTKRPA